MIKVIVRDRYINIIPLWPITSGSVGLPVTFDFDETWDGLTRIVVFSGSGEEVEVALITDACVVPAEVLTTPGGNLMLGVYGRDAYGKTVIPTIIGKAGFIYDGTQPEEPDPSDPTPEWSYQVQQAATEAVRTAIRAEDKADQVLEETAEAREAMEQSEENAAASAQAAATSAAAAAESTSTANSSAIAAASSATAAGNAQAAAENAQDRAETAMDAAEGSAAAAARSATTAGNAELAAKAAQTAAEAAQDNVAQNAQTASTKASDAAASAQEAAESASSAEDDAFAASQYAGYANISKTDAETAKNAAQSSAGAAAGSAEDAEAWARGTRDGAAVESTDGTYHNNAKYYSEQAAAKASDAADSAEEAAQSAQSLVLDTTLTKSGQAADAKAAGDAVGELKSALSNMNIAAASDVGKALMAKTVSDGKVTEWEFGETGGSKKNLVHDNLLEGAGLTADKILAWANGAVTDGGGQYPNYYCTVNAIPCSQHFLPIYVVDKDMTLRAKVFQFFTYRPTGMETHANNAVVPCNVTNTSYPYVASFRMTLNRAEFGDADSDGTWAWAFTAQDYAKHVEARSVYLYEDAPATSITQETVIEREVKSRIANAESLIDSGIMRYVSRNLLDKAVGENGYELDPLGYKYATRSTLYVVDVTKIKPDTLYTFTQGPWLINTAFWLDSNGTPISKLALDSTHYTFTSPSNAYGVRCAVTTSVSSTWANAKVAVYEGDSLLDYEEYYTGKVIRDDYLPGFKHWSQYKYYSIGDSRTAGAGCSDRSKAYPKVIQQMTGIVNVNAAVDGAAYCQRSGISIPTMYEQAASVPLNTDIVTIFGGTNDRIIGVVGEVLNPVCARGTMDYYATESEKYDVTTFRGAIRQTIKNIKLRCPSATIILLVDDLIQSPDGDPQSNAKFIYSGSTAWAKAVDGGASESDMILEVAEEYGLPVIDVSKIAMTGRGGDEYLSSQYKPFTDSLHESDFGNEMLARAVAGEMAKYLW